MIISQNLCSFNIFSMKWILGLGLGLWHFGETGKAISYRIVALLDGKLVVRRIWSKFPQVCRYSTKITDNNDFYFVKIPTIMAKFRL